MKKILIVDDIPDYLDSIESYLEDRFTVLKAATLSDAKKAFSGTIDLAIIDIRLNENDPDNKEGLELLKWIDGNFPTLPVIIMSAYQEFDYAVGALNAGADYFMRKPLDPNELNLIIDKLI